MLKFREKWVWALSLAILLHAGILILIYLNTNKNKTEKLDENNEISHHTEKSEPLTATHIDNNTLSFNSKIDPSTIESSKKIDMNYESIKTITYKVNSTHSVKEDDYQDNKGFDIPLEVKKQPELMETDQSLTHIKSTAGLLDTDIAIQENAIKTNKEYLLMKAEVEEINSHLSAAINEVKKRNQQKIDNIEQKITDSTIQNNEHAHDFSKETPKND